MYADKQKETSPSPPHFPSIGPGTVYGHLGFKVVLGLRAQGSGLRYKVVLGLRAQGSGLRYKVVLGLRVQG